MQYFIYEDPSCAKIFQKVLGGCFFESPGICRYWLNVKAVWHTTQRWLNIVSLVLLLSGLWESVRERWTMYRTQQMSLSSWLRSSVLRPLQTSRYWHTRSACCYVMTVKDSLAMMWTYSVSRPSVDRWDSWFTSLKVTTIFLPGFVCFIAYSLLLRRGLIDVIFYLIGDFAYEIHYCNTNACSRLSILPGLSLCLRAERNYVMFG